MKTYLVPVLTAAVLLALDPGALAHGGGGGHSGGGGSCHGGGGGHGGGFGWHGGGWRGHSRGCYGSYFGGLIEYPFYGGDFGYAFRDDYGGPDYSGVPPPSYSVRRSASLVTEVQDSLAQAGYYRGTVDGRIGPQTRTAIGRYQSRHDLPISRRIDEPLLQSLRLL